MPEKSLFDALNNSIRQAADLDITPIQLPDVFVPALHIDRSPQRTANATETMAEAVAQVVELTRISLDNSERVEKLTRRIGIWSLVVSGISGLASVGALVVSVVALSR